MPDVGATIVRGNVQNASISYKNSSFIYPEVFPKLMLPTSKSKVTIFNKGDQFRDEAAQRARGAETPTIDYKLSTVDVNTYQYAVKHQVTKEDIRDAGIASGLAAPISLQMEAIERNAEKLDLSIEKQVASTVTGATWIDGNSGGEDADAKWVASSGNTFLTDVDTGINTLRANGIPMDSIRLMMDFETWQGVRKNSDIASRTQYTRDVYPTPESIAKYLLIDKCLVAGGIYSSANESQAGTDFTSADIWGGSNNKGFAMVYYFPKRIGLKSMTAGYTLFNKMENGAERATYSWYENKNHSWFYESQTEVGSKQIASAAAYAWKDTHTT